MSEHLATIKWKRDQSKFIDQRYNREPTWQIPISKEQECSLRKKAAIHAQDPEVYLQAYAQHCLSLAQSIDSLYREEFCC
jgi:hypothetical protein